MPPTSDVIVVGGGPAGAATAASLAAVGVEVTVLLPPPARRGAPAGRKGELLSASARPALQQLGAWDAFRTAPHVACPAISTTWGGGGDKTSLMDPYGASWQLDRAAFDRDLLDLAERRGARVLFAAVTGVTSTDCHHQVRWRDRTHTGELQGRWLVDASGRRRVVAGAMGARAEHADRLVAVVAHLPRADDRGRTRVVAARDGWWYSTAVAEGGRVQVCFSDADLPVMRRLRGTGFRRLAAGTSWLVEPVGQRWLAVGDAAMAVDPLSGQGICAALTGGMLAAHEILVGDGHYRQWLAGCRVRTRLEQRAVYSAERRWAEEPFWRRRTSAAPDGAHATQPDGGRPHCSRRLS